VRTVGKESWFEDEYAPSPQRDVSFTTVSGEELEPLYTPEDVGDLDYGDDLGYPGLFPFTRGIQPSMYRGRLWTMRQFAGFGSAEDTNRRYRFLLEKGQTGLSVAFDMPTLMGRDSDDARCEGEVGRCGVAIDSLRDMETLFSGIDLKAITTSMTINGPASVLLAYYLCVGEKQGASFAELGGTIQNDILKEYIAQKSWIFPPRPSLRIITDILAFCSREVPRWNTISISGYHIREAGSTAVQELAFTLADGFAYVEAGIEAGLDVDDFAPRLSFFFNSHVDFFEEIAKYRAARPTWARHKREKYGARDPRSWMLRFHTQTAGCSLTAQQPENNIVRTAFQALSAVLGGTQSLHTNSMDETLALPTEQAVQIALRTQQLIAHETGVVNVIDPLGGSYFLEALTTRMEEQAEEYFRRIEEFGGVLQAIDAGFFQREIADAAYRYQREIESGDRVVVGVNRFQNENETLTIDLLKIDPAVERKQREKLAELRASRSASAVEESLAALRRGAEGDANLMPLIIACARAYCTEGEIIGVLRGVFGEYRETALF
jgi:methylmalonyl-CoA mutase N-terminal domain/subunit